MLLALLGTYPAAAAKFDARVQRAQATLIDKGYSPGPADGLMGRRTRSALKAFQKDSGIPRTGKLDKRTRAVLWPEPQPPSASTPPPETPVQPAQPETKVQAQEARPQAASPGSASPPPVDAAAESRSPKPAPAETPAGQPVVVCEAPRPRGGRLSYARLGWVPPASAAAVASRHASGTTSPIRSRAAGSLVVPEAGAIYILVRGQRLADFDCAPARGRLHMDMAMGRDGPVTFTSLDDEGYCQLGFGILLEEGQVLEFEEAWWGEERIRGGKVRIGTDGLKYVKGG